jgi:hypothetical protein
MKQFKQLFLGFTALLGWGVAGYLYSIFPTDNKPVISENDACRISNKPAVEKILFEKPSGTSMTSLQNTSSKKTAESIESVTATISDLSQPSPVASLAPQRLSSVVTMRINVLENFVQLTKQQRSRLEKKFSQESDLRSQDLSDEEYIREQSKIERLEDIIGDDAANEYRNEQQKIREKFQAQSREQEVAVLSKKLSLSPEQEQIVQQTLQEADQNSFDLNNNLEQKSQNALIQQAISNVETKNKMLDERLKPVLSQEQYKMFQTYQAESPDHELSFWHGK